MCDMMTYTNLSITDDRLAQNTIPAELVGAIKYNTYDFPPELPLLEYNFWSLDL